MIRRQHWLAGNKGTDTPQNVVYVDTETKQVSRSRVSVAHRLWFGWGCYERTYGQGRWVKPRWKRFTRPASFWGWVESLTRANTRTYVFAHNWNFDALVLQLFDELPRRGWQLGQCVIEGPPVIMVWKRGTATLEFLDTLNWWRMPLSAIGKAVGSDKLPMPDLDASRRTWDRYCRQDVDVLRKVLHGWWDFIKGYDLGGFASTLAGQSMRAFRHRFMEHPILIDAHPRATTLARSSYHGGRTECFRLGRVQGPIYCLDVNSMYPAVMRDEGYPTVLKLWSRSITLPELRRYLTRYAVVALVDVETTRPRYAVVQDDRLLFPVGSFRAALTTPELQEGLSRGEIKRVKEAAVYVKAPIFRRFVDELYSLRQEAGRAGRDVDRWMLKILMNSLYGKFAQRGIRWETVGPDPDRRVGAWADVDAETGETVAWRAFAGILQRRSREPESYGSHPAIASHVTAYARTLLWQLMDRAGRANVLYTDTDSLYVNQKGFDKLQECIDPDRLGALKHEATHAWIVLRGPKDYETPKGKVIKGVRSSARWAAPDVAVQEQWSSIKGRIRAEDLSEPTTTTIRKRLQREYRKGVPGPSGSISPFTLTNDR